MSAMTRTSGERVAWTRRQLLAAGAAMQGYVKSLSEDARATRPQPLPVESVAGVASDPLRLRASRRIAHWECSSPLRS
jgi:hypothetical protein